jgi:ligand-binding sensor domain-containing protein
MKARLFFIVSVGFTALLLTAGCGPTPVHFELATLDPSQLAFQTKAAEWTLEPPAMTPTPSVDPSAPLSSGLFPDWTYYAGSPNNHNHIAIDPTSRFIWSANEAGVVQFDIQTALYLPYDRTNGLPDNEVLDIGITPDAKVWVGTAFGGLALFDGTRWKWYTTQQGLLGNGVSEINISTDGKLWIGYTNGGVSRFDGTQWTHWGPQDGLGTEEVTYLELTDPERPVAHTKGNKYFYNGAAWSYSDFPPNGYTIVDSAFSTDGSTQWYAAIDGPSGKGGVVEVKNGKATLYSGGSRIRGTRAYGMGVDNKNVLWIGTDKGLVKFDGKTWATYTTTYGLPSNEIRDVAVTSEGVLWVATDRGLARMGKDARHWVIMTADEVSEDRFSLPIKALAFDPSNVLWISYTDGIHRLEGTNATFFNKTDIKYKEDLTAVLPAPDGTVYFIGKTQIVMYTGGKWKILPASTGFPFKTIQAYAMDSEGRLWIGENRTIAYYQNNKWTKVFLDQSLPVQPQSLTSIAVAPDKSIWVGSTDGLYLCREGVWSYVEVFASTPVHSVTITADGQVWAVAGENVVVNQGADWMMYDGGGNFTEPVERIAVSRDGKIYFVMATRFLIFDGSAAKVVTRTDGLPGGTVSGIAFGEDNDAWFASEYGLAVYHPS